MPQVGIFEHLQFRNPGEQLVQHGMELVLEGGLGSDFPASSPADLSQALPMLLVGVIESAVPLEESLSTGSEIQVVGLSPRKACLAALGGG